MWSSQFLPKRSGPSPLTTRRGSLYTCSLYLTLTVRVPSTGMGSPEYVHRRRPAFDSLREGQSCRNETSDMSEQAAPVSTSMSTTWLSISTDTRKGGVWLLPRILYNGHTSSSCTNCTARCAGCRFPSCLLLQTLLKWPFLPHW